MPRNNPPAPNNTRPMRDDSRRNAVPGQNLPWSFAGDRNARQRKRGSSQAVAMHRAMDPHRSGRAHWDSFFRVLSRFAVTEEIRPDPASSGQRDGDGTPPPNIYYSAPHIRCFQGRCALLRRPEMRFLEPRHRHFARLMRIPLQFNPGKSDQFRPRKLRSISWHRPSRQGRLETPGERSSQLAFTEKISPNPAKSH